MFSNIGSDKMARMFLPHAKLRLLDFKYTVFFVGVLVIRFYFWKTDLIFGVCFLF